MLAATKKRHVVVLDVKRNLIPALRRDDLASIWGSSPWFVKKALVAFGSPTEAFVNKVRTFLIDAEKAKKKALVTEEKTKWDIAQKVKKDQREKANALAKAKADATG